MLYFMSLEKKCRVMFYGQAKIEIKTLMQTICDVRYRNSHDKDSILSKEFFQILNHFDKRQYEFLLLNDRILNVYS